MLDKTGYAAPPMRRSPLDHRQPVSSADGEMSLAEQKFVGKLILRGDASKIGARLTEQTGMILPTTPCTWAATKAATTLWLGPSEWLVLTAEGEEMSQLKAIDEALSGVHCQAVDVTDYYTIIRLSGTLAREMLAKLTTLDLHPRAFTVDAVKGSVFGRIPAVLYHPSTEKSDLPVFDLVIRHSHADYLWCLLALAGREYGLPEQLPIGRVRLAFPH